MKRFLEEHHKSQLNHVGLPLLTFSLLMTTQDAFVDSVDQIVQSDL